MRLFRLPVYELFALPLLTFAAEPENFAPRALQREPAIDFIDMPEALRGKYQYFTRADITKLRGTGYGRATTPLTEAVKDYVQNYLAPGKKLGD